MDIQVVTLPVEQLQALISQAVASGVKLALSEVENYNNDEFLTAEEMSERFGGKANTYHDRRKKGKLKNFRRTGKYYEYSVNEIEGGKFKKGKLS